MYKFNPSVYMLQNDAPLDYVIFLKKLVGVDMWGYQAFGVESVTHRIHVMSVYRKLGTKSQLHSGMLGVTSSV